MWGWLIYHWSGWVVISIYLAVNIYLTWDLFDEKWIPPKRETGTWVTCLLFGIWIALAFIFVNTINNLWNDALMEGRDDDKR